MNFHVATVANPVKLLNEQLRDCFTIKSSMIDSKEDKRARALSKSTIGNCFETGLLWRTYERDRFPRQLRHGGTLSAISGTEAPVAYRSRKQGHSSYVHTLFERKSYARQSTEEDLAYNDTSRTWYHPLEIVVN